MNKERGRAYRLVIEGKDFYTDKTNNALSFSSCYVSTDEPNPATFPRYAVVWLEPSWHCGPFSDFPRMYKLATYTLIGGLPSSLYPVVDYISSPGVVIPAGLLLVLIIYYLLSLTAALREANCDLRVSFSWVSFLWLRMA